MKIIFVVDVFSHYGAEGVAFRLARSAARTNEVQMIFLKGRANFHPGDDSDIDYYFLDSKPGLMGYLKNILQVNRILLKARPDVVISFLTSTNVLSYFSSTGVSARNIYTEHGFPGLNRKSMYLFRFFAHFAYRKSGVFVVSTSLAHSITSFFRLNRESVNVMPVSVSLDFFQNVEENSQRSVREKRKLLFVGRLDTNKRPINAVAVLLDERFSDWSMTVVGDGILHKQLVTFIEQNNLTDRVTVIGYSNEVFKIMDTHTVLVHTSIIEGFGLVLVEALLRNLPVVSTSGGAAGDFLLENNSGLTVPIDASNRQIGDAILTLCGMNFDKSRLRPQMDRFNPTNSWDYFNKFLNGDLK